MKKILLLGAFSLSVITLAQKTNFGLKAGYVLSTINEKYQSEKSSNDPKSSFYVGGFLERKINDKWALQGELLYADLGAKSEQEEVLVVNNEVINYNAKVEINLSTILIPIGVKYYADKNFSINAGVAFGFYVDREIKVKVDRYGETNQIANAYLKTFNFAPYLGLEYNFSEKVFLDTRYNFGLANISQIEQDDYKMRNNFWQIGVGYKF